MKLFIHPLAARQLYPATYPEPCVGSMIREETGEEDAEATRLLELVRAAIVATEFPANGQGFLPLPDEAKGLIMSGAAQVPGELCPKGTDFVVRVHRGEPVLVLERNQLSDEALRPAFVAAIVYTKAAFGADPETTAGDVAAMEAAEATHALITVVATKGPKPPVSTHRFVRNLAGGNAKYRQLLKTDEHILEVGAPGLLNALEVEVKTIVAYEKRWMTVG